MNRLGRRAIATASASLLVLALLPGTALAAAPAAVPDGLTVGVSSSATGIDVLANDIGTSLLVTDVTAPAHGTATIDGSEIAYTPAPSYRGTDAFDYTIEDAVGATASATVSVIVNDPPIALDDPGIPCGNLDAFGGSFPVPEDFRQGTGPYNQWFTLFQACGLLANDTDANGDPLTYEIYTQPAHGEAMKVDDSFFAYKPDPEWGTPAGNLPGGSWVSDSFTYRAFDGLSYSSPATMRYWVAQVNDVPTFTPGPAMVIVPEGVGAYSGLWATNVDPGPYEDTQTVHFELDGPAQLELHPDGPGALFLAAPAIDSDGVLTFTVSPGMSGWARVRMVAKDNGGTQGWSGAPYSEVPDDTSDQFTFDITIVSDGLTLTDDHYVIPEDPDPGPWLISALENDSIQAGSTITAVTQGTLGTVSIAPSGTAVLYAPHPNANGADSFTYTVDDHHGVTDSATIFVDVTPVPDAPEAFDDTVTVPPSAPATAIDVLDNDSDPDGDPVTIQSATNGAHGTVAVTGAGTGLTYDPVTGYTGPDTFTYVVQDGTGRTDVATVHVTIGGDATPPTVAAPAQRFLTQTVGSTLKTRVTWSATDAGSGVKAFTVQQSTNGGTWTAIPLASPTRTFVDRSLTDGVAYRFRVRATDGKGNVSGWQYSPTFRPARFQEGTALATYVGTWGTWKNASHLGGAARYAGTLGKTVAFKTAAYDIGLVWARTTTSGSADIYVDGVFASRVNLRATPTRYRQLVFTRHLASLASHTIEIRPIGTGRVDIDAFVVLR